MNPADFCENRGHPFPRPSCIPTAGGPAYTTHVGLAVAMTKVRMGQVIDEYLAVVHGVLS